MSTQIQIRRDTTANWSSVDPVLAEGEIGYDLTAGQFKVGDGATAWSGLDYSSSDAPDWGDVTGKPEEFPPSAHDHDGVYQPVGDYIEDADSDGKQYARKDGAWSEIAIPDGGTGSSVHIGDTPPADPQEGQQWMEVPADGDATMWIYDGDKWLQQPGGKDGADGIDATPYDDSWIQPALDGKANTGDSYTKTEADAAFEAKGTVVILTQAEYDALTPDANTVYFIK